MTNLNEAVSEAKKKDCRTWGPFLWEKTENGVRIVKLTEDMASVTVPSEIEGLPVTELGEGCFCNLEKLEHITLPDTLKKIGFMALAVCPNLHTLVLPDSVEELSPYMLRDSGVNRLKLSKNLKALPGSVFAFCKGLEFVQLNEGLRSIGPHAFYRTRVGIYEPLVLPDSVEEIAPGAFYDFIGSIRVKTCLPLDPFWFSDLPAPLTQAPADAPSMITAATHEAVLQLLGEAVGKLSQQILQIRWNYQWGLMTPADTRQSAEIAYRAVMEALRDGIWALCRENALSWNEPEFRYLNEQLLIGCGLQYRSEGENGVTVGLIEDKRGDPELAARMHRLVGGMD